MQKAIEIQGAAEIDVDFDQELKRLVKAGSLLKSEGESVEKSSCVMTPTTEYRAEQPFGS